MGRPLRLEGEEDSQDDLSGTRLQLPGKTYRMEMFSLPLLCVSTQLHPFPFLHSPVMMWCGAQVPESPGER